MVSDVDVNPDGTTWALTEILRHDPEDSYVLSRFEDDEWVAYPGPRLADGDARPFVGFTGPIGPHLAAGAEGTAWVVDYRLAEDPENPVGMDLWYFDGSEWTSERDARKGAYDLSLASELVDAGGDGVLWIGLPTVVGQSGDIANEGVLLSYDGQTWNSSGFPHDLCEGSCGSLHSSLGGEVRVFTGDGVALLEEGQWKANSPI